MQLYHGLVSCSPAEGHLGCLQVLAIVDKVVANLRVQALCGHKLRRSLHKVHD